MSSVEGNASAARRMSWTAVWALLFVAGLAGWTTGVMGADAARAWRALLVNFTFFTPLAAGMVVWSATTVVSRGRWQLPLERPALLGVSFAVPSIAALVALWIGSPAWAPWVTAAGLPQAAWLGRTFVFARDLGALLVFWALAVLYISARRRGPARLQGSILIVAYCSAFTLLGFDLVMALDPKWWSTIFGGYFFVSGMYAAVAAWAFAVVWRKKADGDHLHDLGKLILAFSLLATYLMYAQLLTIWYENLPAEVRFVVPRRNFAPWSWVSIALLAVVYLGPLVMLITVWAKRTPWALGTIAGVVLCGLWVERWWLVAPTFQSDLTLGAADVSAFAAFVGAGGLGVAVFGRMVPKEFFERFGDD